MPSPSGSPAPRGLAARLRAHSWSRVCVLATSFWVRDAATLGWGHSKGMSNAALWQRTVPALPLFGGSTQARDLFFLPVWFRYLAWRLPARLFAGLAAFLLVLALDWSPWGEVVLFAVLLASVLYILSPGPSTASKVVSAHEDPARRARFITAHALSLPAAALADPAVLEHVTAGMPPSAVDVILGLAPSWSGTLGELVDLASSDLGLCDA